MSAGFEVRNHTTKPDSEEPELMITIQLLADPGWSVVGIEAAQRTLTEAYVRAFAALTERLEEAQR